MAANEKQVDGTHYKKYGDIQPEEWKDIPSWLGLYQASSLGRIRSIENERTVEGRWGEYTRSYGGQILSPKIGDGGYLYVNLWNANKGHMRAVHRLVCESFNPSLNHEYLVTNHLDGNRQNNHYLNLEFITQKENVKHATQRTGKASWEYRTSQCATSRRNTLSKA
jgi:hypothetical protein